MAKKKQTVTFRNKKDRKRQSQSQSRSKRSKTYRKKETQSKKDTEIFVGADRARWTKSVEKVKPFFIDVIADCFKDPFTVESKTIPMLYETTNDEGDTTTEEQELSYSGSLQLTWSLIGGIVYEYIYDVDTAKKNAPFTPTCDIDLPVCIPDVFYKEEEEDSDTEDDSGILTINFDKVLESTLFKDLVDQIIKRLSETDFSYIDKLLDVLPASDQQSEYPFSDHGKIRIISAEGSKRSLTMVSKKIQLYISVDGQYGEIADIMMKFASNQRKLDSASCVVKKGAYDGIPRNIFYVPLDGLLMSEIDALLNRFQLGNVKTENHIGRILYILNSVVASGNTLQLQSSVMSTIRILAKLAREIDGKVNADVYAKIATKKLCTYKGKDVTIKDIIFPIAPYAVGKMNNPWFIGVFPELVQ